MLPVFESLENRRLLSATPGWTTSVRALHHPAPVAKARHAGQRQPAVARLPADLIGQWTGRMSIHANGSFPIDFTIHAASANSLSITIRPFNDVRYPIDAVLSGTFAVTGAFRFSSRPGRLSLIGHLGRKDASSFFGRLFDGPLHATITARRAASTALP